MSGLLMKDLELLKVNIKTYLIVFLIGIIYLIAQENGCTFFVGYMIFVSIGVAVGTISYDGYHHGMNFLMTLPFTRKQYVRSKYLFAFGFTVAVSAASLILGIARVQFGGAQEVQDILISAGASLFCAGIVLVVMIPMRLKYEIEKSRILMVALVAVLFLIVAALRKIMLLSGGTAGLQFLTALSGWQIAVAMIVVMVICMVVSLKVSDRIMEKKEF